MQGTKTPTVDPTKNPGMPSIIHQAEKIKKIKLPVAPPIEPKPMIKARTQIPKQEKKEIQTKEKRSTYDADNPDELDFDVQNLTGQTLYVTCFAYVQTREFTHWRWSKSPIYELKANNSVTVDIESVKKSRNKKNVFGYLGVFPSEQEAIDSVYELLPDKNKIDLDLLHKIKKKKVTLEIEQYGFKDPFLEHDLIEKKKKKKEVPELDFYVTNNTGKPVFVCGFIYQKKAKTTWFPERYGKDDMSAWRYDKTKVLKLEHGQTELIDVDTIVTERDRSYIRGYLGIFDESEEKIAREKTYELLETKKKINLGTLKNISDKRIILEIKRYGIKDDFIDYTVKQPHKIDFKKVAQK